MSIVGGITETIASIIGLIGGIAGLISLVITAQAHKLGRHRLKVESEAHYHTRGPNQRVVLFKVTVRNTGRRKIERS
jgi:hypothetical protein